jgi:hypothetical protein
MKKFLRCFRSNDNKTHTEKSLEKQIEDSADVDHIHLEIENFENFRLETERNESIILDSAGDVQFTFSQNESGPRD